MRDHRDGSTRRPSARRNAFSPEFLEHLQDVEEPLTAAEADFEGPWKKEPVPGHPGAVAVLREGESLAEGDLPIAVFLHGETATLCCAALPAEGREPLFHLSGQPAPGGPLPGGYPVTAVFGEEGPQVCGWLQRHDPELVRNLHVLESLARSPRDLTAVNEAAGGGALVLVGRYLAARQED
jgi:hypothetical protein